MQALFGELRKRGTKTDASANGACFGSLLLSHKTISGQQRSYVAGSVAMLSESENPEEWSYAVCYVAMPSQSTVLK